MSGDLPFVKRKKSYIEVSSPEGMFAKPAPALNSSGKPAHRVWDLFEGSAKVHGDKNCLGYREIVKKHRDGSLKLSDYKWLSYNQVLDLATCAGSALAEMGAKKNELCMIYGCNTPEFLISMFGAVRQACIPMPLPYWASSTQLAGLIRSLGLRVMMCNAYLLPRFVRACEILEREDVPMTVKAVVIIPTCSVGRDKLPDGYIEEQGKRFKWRTVVTWEKFMAVGRKHENPPHRASGDDIFAVFQTSGTTGESKAVAISNKAALAGCDAICSHPALASLSPTSPLVEYNSVYLAYVGSFAFTLSVLRLGGCTGFPSHPYVRSDSMYNDIKTLAPTHISTTPEFVYMTKYQAVVVTETGNVVQRMMIKSALKEGSVATQLVSSSQKKWIGGRLNNVCIGGGFLTPNALAFAKSFMGRDLIQAYGQSEYFGCGLVTPDHTRDTSTEKYSSTSSGFCMPGTSIRLVNVGDGSQFGIHQNPPTGEMFVRSNSMFTAYLSDDKATFSVLDDDGWFRSGDIGQLNPDGSISVIARISQDLKRNNGFFAQCSMMNQAYSMSSLCKHVFTYVRRDVPFTVAVVDVNVEALHDCAMLPSSAREVAAKARANPHSAVAKKMLTMPEIRELFIREFARIADDNHFNALEVIRGVILDCHEWNAENSLLTPTGKLCEVELLRKYQDSLDKLVEDMVETHPELVEIMPKEEPNLSLFDDA